MPSVGIKGARWAPWCAFGIVSVLELAAIKRVTPHPPKYLRVFGKATVAAVLMGAAAWASYGLLSGHFGNTLSVAGAILVGCVVYVILVVALRVVSKDDLSLMPKGGEDRQAPPHSLKPRKPRPPGKKSGKHLRSRE